MVERPRVIIVGGGFGGLSAVRALRNAPVDLTLIDRTNHHLFQPLLYQVATGVLSPADVAVPLRVLVRGQSNTTVLMADVESIDTDRQSVIADGGNVCERYDYLIIATGARHSYFGHAEWEPLAPGLKTLDDARDIRRRFLSALETAEKSADPAEHAGLLTFVIVGGGPTGVELAGILPTIARTGFRRDFRRVDVSRVRVLLLEAGPRLLPSFPADLSRRARADLEELGVECRTSARVTRLTAESVWIGNERIPARTVFWAAGNEASPLIRSLNVPIDASGRAHVSDDLSLSSHPEVFVIGDACAARMARHGNESTSTVGDLDYVPALAAAAMQMGEHAARTIQRRLKSQVSRPFRYRDRGTMAVIGRGRAIATFRRLKVTGPFAFYLWLLVHLLYLAGGFRNRAGVLLEWAYAYFTYQPGARLLTKEDADPVAAAPSSSRKRC